MSEFLSILFVYLFSDLCFLFSAFGRDNCRGIALTPPFLLFIYLFIFFSLGRSGDVADIHSQFYASIAVSILLPSGMLMQTGSCKQYNVMLLAGNVLNINNIIVYWLYWLY